MLGNLVEQVISWLLSAMCKRFLPMLIIFFIGQVSSLRVFAKIPAKPGISNKFNNSAKAS